MIAFIINIIAFTLTLIYAYMHIANQIFTFRLIVYIFFFRDQSNATIITTNTSAQSTASMPSIQQSYHLPSLQSQQQQSQCVQHHNPMPQLPPPPLTLSMPPVQQSSHMPNLQSKQQQSQFVPQHNSMLPHPLPHHGFTHSYAPPQYYNL